MDEYERIDSYFIMENWDKFVDMKVNIIDKIPKDKLSYYKIGLYGLDNNKRYVYLVINNKNLEVSELEDDWFIVSFEDAIYKCDQLYGLIKFLKDEIY